MISRIFFISGLTAVMGGLALAGWLLLRSQPDASIAAALPPPQILVATHDIAPGQLLRGEDMRWRTASAKDLATPALPHPSQVTEADIIGAAARRPFVSDEPFTMGALVRRGEPGFLAAALAPGMRAVAIAIGDAGATAALLAPGDRVDIILMQNFSAAEASPAHKSVSETILHDLRVIATDPIIATASRTNAPAGRVPGAAATPDPRQPRSVTLELTESQTEKLFVALELGKAELALRSAFPVSPGASAPQPPTWAADVSPALNDLRAKAQTKPATGPRESPAIQVMRGSKLERLCIDPQTGAVSDCGTARAPP